MQWDPSHRMFPMKIWFGSRKVSAWAAGQGGPRAATGLTPWPATRSGERPSKWAMTVGAYDDGPRQAPKPMLAGESWQDVCVLLHR